MTGLGAEGVRLRRLEHVLTVSGRFASIVDADLEHVAAGRRLGVLAYTVGSVIEAAGRQSISDVVKVTGLGRSSVEAETRWLHRRRYLCRAVAPRLSTAHYFTVTPAGSDWLAGARSRRLTLLADVVALLSDEEVDRMVAFVELNDRVGSKDRGVRP